MRVRFLLAPALTLAVGAALAVSAQAAPAEGSSRIVTAPGLYASATAVGLTMTALPPGTVNGPSGSGQAAALTFKFPVVGANRGLVQHGGALVLTNTANGRVVELRNFQIDIAKRQVMITVPQAGPSPIPALVVANNPKIASTKVGQRTRTVVTGAKLAIAPGMGWRLNLLLGLWGGSAIFYDGQVLGTADMTSTS